MLLKKIKHWFNNDTQGSDAIASTNLTHGKMIPVWLTRYRDQNQLMNIAVLESGGEVTTFSTGILYVDLENKQFFFEEICPETSKRCLIPGAILHFSVDVNGVNHQFKSRFIQTNRLPEGTSHQCEFPRAIEQIQLRNAFRVKIPISMSTTISLKHPVKFFLSGQVADLSISGARLRINNPLPHELERGDLYSSGKIRIPNGTEIICQGKIMHWRQTPEHKVTHIGIMFLKMESQHERQLVQFLNELQRRQRVVSR